MGSGLAKTEAQGAPDAHPSGGLRLFVAGEGRFATHHLPDSGRVTIGRDPSCELHVDDPSVAPRHAVLSMGPPVRIEDLGSGLLTSIRQDRVEPGEPAEVAPGDILHVGGVILMVEGRGTAPPRRILPHGYFEMRLEEECHRAGRGGRPRTGSAKCARDGGSADALLARANSELAPRPAAQEAAPAAGAMQDLYRMVERIAWSDISVLIFGETGVGKERLAEAVHKNSRRASMPFLRLNCAALTETLLESELFGHEKGSFTGAQSAKAGLLES